MREYSIAFATLDRPLCLERALRSIKFGGWKFRSRVVIDSYSNEENLKRNIEICGEYGFSLCLKGHRTGTANSYNLAMLYSDSRHVIISADDIIFLPDGLWLEEIEKGFEQGYFKIEVPTTGSEPPTVAWAVDKNIVTKIWWLDERFTASGCEDNDWIIRLREELRTNKVLPDYNRNGLLFHMEEAVQPSYWKYGTDRSDNKDFFLEKWKIRRDALMNFPDRKMMTDDELIQFVHLPGHVERQLDEIDFYPEVTARYVRGDYSAVKGLISPIVMFLH